MLNTEFGLTHFPNGPFLKQGSLLIPPSDLSPSLSLRPLGIFKKQQQYLVLGGAERACDFPEGKVGIKLGWQSSNLPNYPALGFPKSVQGLSQREPSQPITILEEG